jgi:hypothetical protein
MRVIGPGERPSLRSSMRPRCVSAPGATLPGGVSTPSTRLDSRQEKLSVHRQLRAAVSPRVLGVIESLRSQFTPSSRLDILPEKPRHSADLRTTMSSRILGVNTAFPRPLPPEADFAARLRSASRGPVTSTATVRFSPLGADRALGCPQRRFFRQIPAPLGSLRNRRRSSLPLGSLCGALRYAPAPSLSFRSTGSALHRAWQLLRIPPPRPTCVLSPEPTALRSSATLGTPSFLPF